MCHALGDDVTGTEWRHKTETCISETAGQLRGSKSYIWSRTDPHLQGPSMPATGIAAYTCNIKDVGMVEDCEAAPV